MLIKAKYGVSLIGIMKHTQLLSMACLSEVVPASEKPSYFGYFGAAIGVGFIIGPIIGGFLLELTDGFRWICTLTSLIFILNACMHFNHNLQYSITYINVTPPSQAVIIFVSFSSAVDVLA